MGHVDGAGQVFQFAANEGGHVLVSVYAVRDWCAMALNSEVGLLDTKLDDFSPALEHAQMDAGRGVIG